MACSKILEQICDELAEDMNSELCHKIKEHLEICPDCRNQVNSMRTTVNLYQCLKEKQVPQNIHERLVKLLNIPETT